MLLKALRISVFEARLRYKCNEHFKYLSSQAAYEQRIVKSPAPNVELSKGNFVDFIFQNSHKWHNLTAMECSMTGYKITYSQLVDQSRRWSGFLKRIGIGKGDVVAAITSNDPHYGPIFFGTAAIGAVLSPINPRFTSTEISKLLRNNNANVVLILEEVEDVVNEALKDVPKPIRQLCIGVSKRGRPNVIDILTNDSLPFADPVDLSGDEPLILPFSSGTTGFPKATAISHNSFIANTLQFMNPYHDVILHNAADHPQEIFLAMLPFFHIYGSFLILTIAAANGFKVVTVPKFDPATFATTVVKHKISYLHTVPSLLHFLLSRKECNAVDMAHIHTVFCGAAPVFPASAKEFCEKVEKDVAFLEGYGLTEAMITHINPRHSNRIGCAGQPLSNVEVKIVDIESGNLLSANQSGEIWLRSPSNMLYYLGNPEATSNILTHDGWLRTGDIGFYDDEGFFSIVDRMKDLIKVNGLQVSPSEVEEVLTSHPAVLESSVIGIPDERRGEVPKAFIVLKGKVSEKELQELVASKLSKHKNLVGGIVFVDSLPKSDTGKVLKKELRNRND